MKAGWRGSLPRARAMLLAAACVVSYANGLAGDFTYDDKAIILDNPRIRAPARLGTIFATPYFGGPRGQGTGYRPVLLVSYAIQYWVHGAAPVGFHVVNVALHVLVTLLLALALARIDVPEPVAFGAALLFAVHPIHVEAVTSLVGRGEMLAAAFSLGVLLFALRYRRERRARGLSLTLALLCFALGILSKESATVAPLLVLLAWWRLESGGAGERLRKALAGGMPVYAGCALLLGAGLAARSAVLGGVIKAPTFRIFELENPLAHVSTVARVTNAAAILFRYAGRLLLPVRLSADESGWSIPVARGGGLVGIAAVLLGAAILVVAFRREREKRDLAFGVLFFAAAFAMTANVFFAIGTIFAERIAYLPSAGFALALASTVIGAREATAPSRRRALLLVAIAVAYGARTVARNPVWKDDETLFASTVATSPGSAKAHYNLGWVSADRGRLPLALEEYRRATEIYPKYFDAWAGKGSVEQRLGRLPDAERSFRRSLQARPDYENGFFRLGALLEFEGNLEGAEKEFSEGLARNPKSTALAFRLARVRSRLGRPSADADWRRAIALARDAAAFHLGYAEWLFERGRTPEARREAREVLRRRPRNAEALRILAASSRETGRRFSEGLAVEKIFRATSSAADFDRLARIAAEDPAYRERFEALRPSLEKIRSRPPEPP
ncbi:MAG TPA: tetratricopeptide repeat protein [Thermoanaerobaculia bacterium]